MALVAWGLLAACGTSPDPVAHGQLCTPDRDDCPTRTTLTRSETGSNILDIAVTNEGPPATILFTVDRSRSGDASGTGDAAQQARPGDPFPVQYQLDSGETTTDRFGASELFTRKRLRLRVGCRTCEECEAPCRANLEYAFMTEPLECDSDGDCRGDRICHARTGKCVDCLDDGDCDDEQSCDPQSGRCLPPSTGGCRQVSGGPLPFSLFALLGLGLLGWRRRRRGSTRILAGVVVAAVLAGVPSEADARAPSSTITIGVGPRFVTGDLGADVRRGLGAELHQTLHWKYIGIDFWIETSYFVTSQAPPPLTRELQVFGFGAGPRAYLPIGSFEVIAGAGYQRTGFGPNPLVEQTGPDANFHTVGGTLGVGYRFSSFVVRTDAQYFPILGADGALLSFNVSFGVSTR